jgi:hypothetical protein
MRTEGPDWRQMFQIDEQLREFVESGVAVIVGTGDAARRPHVIYGWGPRVHPGGTTIDFFIDRIRSDQALSDVGENPRVALTVTDPVSARSVQFKGAFRESGAPDETDEVWVARHREAFLVTTALIGDPPDIISALWTDEVVRMTFDVERAFDQTPGPVAGSPL